MKVGKGAKIALAVVLVAAIAGGGIFFFANRQPSKAVTVVPVSNVYTTYWGDSKTLDGFVTSGSMQEVRMTENGFDRVAVKEGDIVRKGDTLVEYDNTHADLQLRSDLARINLLKAQITAFEKQTSDCYLKIGTLQKALDDGQTSAPSGGSTTPSTPSGGTAVTPTVPVVTAKSVIDNVTEDAANKDVSGVGTPEKPYRLLCTKDAQVTAHFWQTFPSTSYNFILDVYSDTNCTQWLARWTVKTTLTTTPGTPWQVMQGLTLDTATGQITGFDAAQLPSYGTLTLTMPDDLIEKLPVGSDPNALPQTAAEIKAKIEELRQEIDSCNKQIDACKQDLRQAQITYEKNKLTQSAGKIVASVDGTVATVGDQTTPVGEVFLRVQGESRYAVTLYVNELMLGEVTPGTTVQLMCYESGTMTSAVITKTDTEPVNGYYSGGNMNSSTYQVTAEISDENAQPRLGEWCQATLDGQIVNEPSDTIYLPLFLIREDEGGSYVMMANEENRLQKQYIATGKSLWGSYVEIKSGVTMEDRLAFPYGKTVRDGAPVEDSDYFY